MWITRGMFSSRPTVLGGQPRKTRSQRFLDLLNTSVWHCIPPSLVIFIHYQKTASVCSGGVSHVYNSLFECIQETELCFFVFTRFHKMSVWPLIGTLTYSRDCACLILGYVPCTLCSLRPSPGSPDASMQDTACDQSHKRTIVFKHASG